MPDSLLLIFAQQAPGAPQPPVPDPKPTIDAWTEFVSGPTTIFGHEYKQPGLIAIPILLVSLACVSIIVERVAAWLVKKLTSRTKTTVDDAFVVGLPKLVRTVLVFVAE